MSDALNAVLQERGKQKEKFAEFDKTNSKNDWVSYVAAYTGRAADRVARNEKEGQTFRTNMIKAAAICLAAVEAHDAGYC